MTDATWQPPTVRLSCPLPDCSWVYDEPSPWPLMGTAGPDAAPDALAARFMRSAQSEEIVRSHLEDHPILEWVQEVQRLNGIRAHVARELGADNPIGALIGAAVSRNSPAAQAWRACLDWLRDDGNVQI